MLDVNLGSNNGNFFALRGSHLVAMKERKVTAEREGERRVRGGEEEEKGDGIYNFPDPLPLFASAFQFEW